MTSYVDPPTIIPMTISSANDINLISLAIKALWVGTAAGDIEYYINATTKARVAIGAYGTLLMSDGTKPVWKYQYELPSWVATTAGDMEYDNGDHTKTRIPIGDEGDVFSVVSGVPGWYTDPDMPQRVTFSHCYAGSTDAVSIVSNNAWQFVSSAASIYDTDGFLNANPATHFRVPSSALYGRYRFCLTLKITSAAGSYKFGLSQYTNTSTASLIANTERTYDNVTGTITYSVPVYITSASYYYAPIIKYSGTVTATERYWYTIRIA